MGTRNYLRRESTLYSEIETLRWAIESMFQHSICQTFGTDYKDLIAIIKELHVLPSFATKLNNWWALTLFGLTLQQNLGSLDIVIPESLPSTYTYALLIYDISTFVRIIKRSGDRGPPWRSPWDPLLFFLACHSVVIYCVIVHCKRYGHGLNLFFLVNDEKIISVGGVMPPKWNVSLLNFLGARDQTVVAVWFQNDALSIACANHVNLTYSR